MTPVAVEIDSVSIVGVIWRIASSSGIVRTFVVIFVARIVAPPVVAF